MGDLFAQEGIKTEKAMNWTVFFSNSVSVEQFYMRVKEQLGLSENQPEKVEIGGGSAMLGTPRASM